MAIVQPINLDKWQPGTPIISDQAKQEFNNLYNAINGNLDSANIKNASITSIKLANNSVTNDKIDSIVGSKITGKVPIDSLPDNILTTSGGTVNGTVVFDVPQSTALLKNYDNEEIVLYEGGTGENKIKLIVGGQSALRITVNDVVLWNLTTAGVEIPKAFLVPLE